MSGVLEYPKLRWPLELRMELIEGNEVIYINCPLGVAKQPLFLIPSVAPIISCFEGNLSVPQIVERFAAHGLDEKIVRELVTLLDEHLFLATPRFFAAQQTLLEEFSNSDTRPASLAGLGYSANPAELRKQLDGYMAHAVNGVSSERMLGLVAPHIDYRRGAISYGMTYANLKPQEHDLYILIGTSHQYSRHMFHLSRKHFDSPLGRLDCDRTFVEKLAALYGDKRSFADEILHKREHSLDLQLPFLGYYKKQSKIVPILVGSFHEMLHSGKNPRQFEQYDKFADGLAVCLKNHIGEGKSFCFIAGVDMAHIGRHFGDAGALNPEIMAQIARRDKAYLDAIENQDKKALWNHISEDGDARRICGFPTMYTVLDTLDQLGLKYKAKIFDYRQAVDYATDCAVTFAGVGLYV